MTRVALLTFALLLVPGCLRAEAIAPLSSERPRAQARATAAFRDAGIWPAGGARLA